MARPRATPAQRNEQRRRIRQAAADIYDAEGLSGVSVRAIAARAGTSQGTIYSYFTNLSELLRSLWAQPVAETNRRLEKVAAEVTDPIERLRRLLETYVEFALENPDVYRGALMFVRPASHPAPEREPLDEVAFFRLLAQALDEAKAQDLVDTDDTRQSAELLWAALHGSIALRSNADIYDITPTETLAPAMIDLLLSTISRPGIDR